MVGEQQHDERSPQGTTHRTLDNVAADSISPFDEARVMRQDDHGHGDYRYNYPGHHQAAGADEVVTVTDSGVSDTNAREQG